MKESKPVVDNAWRQLRRFTDARIALGRAGVSLPTTPHLEFQSAHAQARDAVHLAMNGDALEKELSSKGFEVLRLHSAASDRRIYLQRPDLGRRLDDTSRRRIETAVDRNAPDPDAALVIADGLSALAVHRNATALLERITANLAQANWRVAPIVLVEQGRVAVGDEIGEVLGAEMVAILIGERPGLSSPDSLGVYLTYRPRLGATDAERNCISNIRAQGLGMAAAADKLYYLMSEARRRKLSGVALKDESGSVSKAVSLDAGSFLTEGNA